MNFIFTVPSGVGIKKGCILAGEELLRFFMTMLVVSHLYLKKSWFCKSYFSLSCSNDLRQTAGPKPLDPFPSISEWLAGGLTAVCYHHGSGSGRGKLNIFLKCF